MLTTRLELNRLQTEGIPETLRVQLLTEPFDGVNEGSGLVTVSLLVGQNTRHASYDRSFAKTLKKDFVVQVNKNQEKDVLMALWTDGSYQEITAQALFIIEFLRGQRDAYVKEYVRILRENTKRAPCLLGEEGHLWKVDAIHPSGNFKARHCLVCSTKETVGT